MKTKQLFLLSTISAALVLVSIECSQENTTNVTGIIGAENNMYTENILPKPIPTDSIKDPDD